MTQKLLDEKASRKALTIKVNNFAKKKVKISNKKFTKKCRLKSENMYKLWYILWDYFTNFSLSQDFIKNMLLSEIKYIIDFKATISMSYTQNLQRNNIKIKFEMTNIDYWCSSESYKDFLN